MRRTTKLLVLCGGLLTGLVIARQLRSYVDVSTLYLAIILTLVGLFLRRSKILGFVALFSGSFIFGWYRGAVVVQELAKYEPLRDQTVQLIVRAKTDGVYAERSQIEFVADQVELEFPRVQELVGQITVSGFGASSITRGDLVRVEGKMRDNFGNRQGFVRFAKLELVARSGSSVEAFRKDFQTSLYGALPEPQGSFATGLLIGQRSDLPDYHEENLRTVGLTHIIAVSGYNLTIIAEIVRKRFQRRSRYQATVASVGLVLVFVAIAGTSPSVNRAAMVAILAVGASYFGRSFRPILLLAMPAALTAIVSPLSFWFDIGWWLSFLAFFGILIVAPILRKLLRIKRETVITQVLSESLSASLMTLPLILLLFGRLPVYSLIANMLIVPLVPLAMVGSTIVGLFGMILPEIVGWIAWPVTYLLTYMLDIAALIAKLPNAIIDVKLSSGYMFAIYGIFLMFLLSIRKRQLNRGTITETKKEKTHVWTQ